MASAAKKSRVKKGIRGKAKPVPAAAAVAAAAAAARSSTAAGAGAGASSGYVLGGADYVDIVMGGRRREREEAQKLAPRDFGLL